MVVVVMVVVMVVVVVVICGLGRNCDPLDVQTTTTTAIAAIATAITLSAAAAITTAAATTTTRVEEYPQQTYHTLLHWVHRQMHHRVLAFVEGATTRNSNTDSIDNNEVL